MERSIVNSRRVQATHEAAKRPVQYPAEFPDWLLSHLSHGIRTPLTVMREYASLVREISGEELTPLQSRFLNIIDDRTDEMDSLVSDLLDAGRLATGTLVLWLERVNAGDFLRGLKGELKQRAELRGLGIEFDFTTESDIFCEPERTKRIVMQLAAMAFAAHSGKTPIRIRVFNGDFTRESEGDAATLEDVVFEISYEGEPLPANVVSQMFAASACLLSGRHGDKSPLAQYVTAQVIERSLGSWNYQANGHGKNVGADFADDPAAEIETVTAQAQFQLRLPRCRWEVVLPRYIQLLRARNEEEFTAVIVTADCGSSPPGRELTGLLRYPLTCADLLFELERNRHVICTPGKKENAESILQQINVTRADMNRIRRDAQLPEIQAEILGPWSLDESEMAVELLSVGVTA